jgi:hypothetical protein
MPQELGLKTTVAQVYTNVKLRTELHQLLVQCHPQLPPDLHLRPLARALLLCMQDHRPPEGLSGNIRKNRSRGMITHSKNKITISTLPNPCMCMDTCISACAAA